MVTEALVTEHVVGGEALAEAVAAVVPLKSWFWLKEAEDDRWDEVWRLYLVTERRVEARAEARKYLHAHKNAWFDSDNVRAVAPDTPLARAVFDIQTKAPQILPDRFTQMLGNVFARDSYIYAPAAAPAAA